MEYTFSGGYAETPKVWQRDEKVTKKDQRLLPVSEKESARWIEGFHTACSLQAQAPDTLIVSLSDREGDIYELFEEARTYPPKTRAQWLVRASQDRCLLEEDPSCSKIFDKLKDAPQLGEIEFSVQASKTRSARQVVQSIRSATIKLKPPARCGYKLSTVRINAVFASETNPPEGEKPIEWLLLTSLPVRTFEQAATIVEWYTCRWEIEIFFHILKDGCKIQKLQFETKERLLPCVALYMIVAWRVLFLTMLGRQCPELDCEVVFTPEEWQAIYRVVKQKPPPQKPPTLGKIIPMVASLGGFLQRKHDGFPGPKAIWTGLQRVKDFVLAINAFHLTEKICV